MTSNTKLTPDQKFILKDLKHLAKMRGIELANNGQTTVAYVIKGNTIRFSTSVMSEDETKFRRKVGEYYALIRLMDYDNYVVLNIDDFNYLLGSLGFEQDN